MRVWNQNYKADRNQVVITFLSQTLFLFLCCSEHVLFFSLLADSLCFGPKVAKYSDPTVAT